MVSQFLRSTYEALKIGITGVRGIVGESFTPELLVEFAQALGTYMDGGRILHNLRVQSGGPDSEIIISGGFESSGAR